MRIVALSTRSKTRNEFGTEHNSERDGHSIILYSQVGNANVSNIVWRVGVIMFGRGELSEMN